MIPRARRLGAPAPHEGFDVATERPRARSAFRPRVRALAVVAALVPPLLLASLPPSAAAPDLRSRLNIVAARIARAQTTLERTRAEAARSHARALTARRAAASSRARIATLARAMYVAGPIGSERFLGATSLAELSARIAFVERLQAYERSAGERAAVDHLVFERHAAALRRAQRAQAAGMRELRSMQERLRRLFAEQLAAAARAGGRPRAARSARAGGPAAAFVRLVSGGGPFRVCPVDPPRAYSNDFGAPRAGHTHQGNDILAPRGTPIRAPFDGRIRRSSSSAGGISVTVYGARGYVYNAHLDGYSSAAGSVRAGTVIGYVGDSGNARGGPTHNHFEWHPGNGAAVNPFPYLNMVC